MFNWLFGYKAHPDTKVEIWVSDIFSASEESAKGNKSLVRITTWKDYDGQRLCSLSRNFGPNDTIVACWVRTETESGFFACSVLEFEKRSNHIPTRSMQERDLWFDRVIEAQEKRIAELDEHSHKLGQIIQKCKDVQLQLNSLL